MATGADTSATTTSSAPGAPGAPGTEIRTASPVAAPRRGGLAAGMEVLRMRDFQFLLVGNAMMFAGFQVRNMGQAWLVLDLTDSSLWVGVVNAMPGIAIIFISLLGGAAADRSERWRIQVIAKFVIASMAFLTAFLVTSGAIQAWHLIPIGLVTGSMFAFHNPASQTFAMDIVGRERLMSAVSLNTTLSQTATIIGPAVGGFLLAAGLDAAFYLLGGLYGTGLMATLLIRTRSKPADRPRRKISQEISEGLRYAAGNEAIKWLLVISSGGIFTGNVLHTGDAWYGKSSMTFLN